MSEPSIGIWQKYLVLRRDGTVPGWPWFVLGARDPAAPYALRAYAGAAREMGMAPAYVGGVAGLATAFIENRLLSVEPPGDPDAGPHRKDDPLTLQLARGGITMAEIASRLCARPIEE